MYSISETFTFIRRPMGDFHLTLQLDASPAAYRPTSRTQIAPIEFAPCWPPGAGNTWPANTILPPKETQSQYNIHYTEMDKTQMLKH